MIWPTRSSGSRLIFAIEDEPSSRNPSAPSTISVTVVCRTSSRETSVEEADERPDRAGGIVVLGLAEQQGRAALHVAQVDVVAEHRADDRPVEDTTRTTSGSGLFQVDLA